MIIFYTGRAWRLEFPLALDAEFQERNPVAGLSEASLSAPWQPLKRKPNASLLRKLWFITEAAFISALSQS